MDVSEEQPLKPFAATLVGTVSRKFRKGSRYAIKENLFAALPREAAEQQSTYTRKRLRKLSRTEFVGIKMWRMLRLSDPESLGSSRIPPS
jgi:hypothetical protein